MNRYSSAIIFALVPGALVTVLLVALDMNTILAGIVGGGLTGLGLDVCLKGSDRRGCGSQPSTCTDDCNQGRNCACRNEVS